MQPGERNEGHEGQISCRESASRNGMKFYPPGGLTSAGTAVYSGATVPESHRLLPTDTEGAVNSAHGAQVNVTALKRVSEIV